ncbi:unnamed protein product [Anisakis simplex]|uniref:Beta-1,3-glucosyltransferase (inferred by orthology to a human protein) n=1 Tax=Anisakis simplex TaxID=6269 RepID=A0A0M3IZ38_ANISI|nr:unnamed protein product [Anisakis simplex]
MREKLSIDSLLLRLKFLLVEGDEKILFVIEWYTNTFHVSSKYFFVSKVSVLKVVLLCGSVSLKELQNCVLNDTSNTVKAVTNEDVLFAVKTYHANHKKRIVIVKRTWAKMAKFVEYFSDMTDQYVPTIDLGVNNTERGHCEKTLSILKYFLGNDEMSGVQWLAVVDDDTLIGVPRLYRLLSCYSPLKEMIIGERYGYGFSTNGKYGYEYPTGGAGMVFSRPAVQRLIGGCRCPSLDSPDDMIIGMCARRLQIPIIHSAAFHQARSIDYSPVYIQRISPISFHKFEEIDPYEDYMQLLHERGTIPANRPSSHSEL